MNNDNDQLKAIVTVAEMSRMVGLSRARFYQLQAAGIFPLPVYDIATRRPVYTEDQQRICLEVRRKNVGINGKAILFYAKGSGAVPVAARCSQKRENVSKAIPARPELLAALVSLGIASLTARQVDQAVAQVFPKGTDGTNEGSIIRALYLHFRRQNSADKPGR